MTAWLLVALGAGLAGAAVLVAWAACVIAARADQALGTLFVNEDE